MPVALRLLPLALLPCCPAQTPAPSRELAEIAAAYAAKVTASALFVSGRTLDSVLAEELAPTRPLEALIRPLLRFEVDRDAGTVTCRLGAATATAVRTGNLGCTLVRPDATAAMLRARAAPGLADLRAAPANEPWPRGDLLPKKAPSGIDVAAVRRAVANAFVPAAGGPPIHTRAVVVLHDGQLVAEQYAPGLGPDTPLPGWSMTKTLTHALLGVRIAQGQLDPSKDLPVAAWRDDDRRTLRLDDLLTMTAGLAWNEDYADPASDALRMLFASSDHAAVYAARPRRAPAGKEFCYASGSTNLLCHVLRCTFRDDRDYWAFPRLALFQPLGMRTAMLETDPGGTFVGSSYGFASARDWARLGQFYLDDGVVGGQRLLPPGWVENARTVHPASHGRYGRHVWRHGDPDGDGPATCEWPDLPDDVFSMDGHEGQHVVVFPSARAVVVRLGCSKNGGIGLHALLRDVLAAIRR